MPSEVVVVHLEGVLIFALGLKFALLFLLQEVQLPLVLVLQLLLISVIVLFLNSFGQGLLLALQLAVVVVDQHHTLLLVVPIREFGLADGLVVAVAGEEGLLKTAVDHHHEGPDCVKPGEVLAGEFGQCAQVLLPGLPILLKELFSLFLSNIEFLLCLGLWLRCDHAYFFDDLHRHLALVLNSLEH